MSIEDLNKSFGEEYPAAIVSKGIRFPLCRETKFTRVYCSPTDRNEEHHFSRFMDGSASITLPQLQREWPDWTESERIDFCNGCSWLSKQPDYSDMLHFIIEHSGPVEWSVVALEVGAHLPKDEAFDTLVRILATINVGETSNITQAIAKTKHPQAEPTLRNHLRSIWEHARLWNDDSFLNWVAFDATTCIAQLIELGALPSDFEEQARQLSRHVCSGNRESCRNFLGKHYSWIQ